MFDGVMGNSLWYLVQQSDLLSKLILVVLCCMSISCLNLFI
jgi:hypothetical protein